MKKSLLLGIVALALTGCAMVPSNLGFALIQADKEAVTATDAPARRVGKACGFNLLGIIAAGDISIKEAKQSAGIQRVSSVDKEVFSLLGLYSSVCTIVTGE
ncbi:MAG: TRL-like family protein [Alphaproteobacteria bacterium]|nr:TRL-like family protein [Alphaproteobacteria bacterium]